MSDDIKRRIDELRNAIRVKQGRINQIEQEKNQLTVDIIGATGAIAELEKIIAPSQPVNPGVPQQQSGEIQQS